MKCPNCSHSFSAADAGMPKPPKPPNTLVRIGFFGGESETPRSKERTAYYNGASAMWNTWMDSLGFGK